MHNNECILKLYFFLYFISKLIFSLHFSQFILIINLGIILIYMIEKIEILLYINNSYMGIHKFNTWIKEKYINCFDSIENLVYIDNLYIDLNYIFHIAVNKTSNMVYFKEKVISCINNILKNIIPNKELIFAVDGPCCYAKILLQRQRRYDLIKNIPNFDKYVEKNNFIHSIYFTSGTIFMNNLEYEFKDFFDEIEKKYKIKIIKLFTGSDEAEMKIINKINADIENCSHMFFSKDSDVIVMSICIKNYSNISVSFIDDTIIKIFNIKKFVEKIQLKSRYFINNLNKDICLLFLLLGNDYLPKLKNVNFDKLFNSYFSLIKKNNQKTFFEKNKVINIKFFKKFLIRLSEQNNIPKFKLSEFKPNICANYINGIFWCLNSYIDAKFTSYNYMYNYNSSIKILDLYYYIVFINPNLNIHIKISNSIPINLYSYLVIPKKALKLLENNKILTDKINKLFEIEDCLTCIEFTKNIQSLADSIKYMRIMDEDVNNLLIKNKENRKSYTVHKTSHRIINNNDIEKIINESIN
jgi:5'-3' exonuclease